MTQPSETAKSDLRRILRERRRQRTAGEPGTAPIRIRELLRAAFPREETVILYRALPDEIDLLDLARDWLAQGRAIAFPAVVSDDEMVFRRVTDLAQPFVAGYRGIPQPGEDCSPISAEGALVLVPGLAFTLRGERLGRGRGYYDRALARCNCIPVGITLDEDILPALPVAGHDVRMSYICSEQRLIRCTL